MSNQYTVTLNSTVSFQHRLNKSATLLYPCTLIRPTSPSHWAGLTYLAKSPPIHFVQSRPLVRWRNEIVFRHLKETVW